jgi:uncharacterized membrane protein HdeD (DUF308 family)
MIGSSTAVFWKGVFALGLGIVTMVWPGITLGAIVVLFAVYAFVAAGMDAMRAFSSDKAGPVFGWLLLALLSAAGGVVALAWPGITVYALTVWIGVWALVTGVTEIALAFSGGETAGERAMFALTGLASVLLAVLLFVRPDIGAVSLATVFSLFSMFYGISGIILSFQLRKAGNTIADIAGAVAHGI